MPGIVPREGTYIPIFYIFKYGTESDAKWYFIIREEKGNISWGQHIMGTDNSIVDKSEKDEMMNNFSEEKNEKTDSEVNDDATNIDGDTDDMIEEKDYCNYP